jgi:hypothetical protein
MAAGVTNRLWSVEESASLWEAYEQRDGKTGSLEMHEDVTCKGCGKDFEVDDPDSPALPMGTFSATCPREECQCVNLIKWPMGGNPKVNPK